MSSTSFADLGVAPVITERLAARGIHEAFPIQAATIPDALAGRDLCGKAPTGSGKTIAFGIPMISLVQRAAPKRPKGLVLAPTRELALQVAEELRALSSDLRVLAVYGGAGIEPQIKKLRAGVDIVVACPGRLLDVIDRKACDLRDVRFAVVDEADRMADMGFLPDVRRILDQTNDDRQTLLFSATLDGAIDALVKRYQHDPAVHEMADEDVDLTHHLWTSERPERAQLTAEIIERVGPTIVFSRTRHGADRIAKQIGRLGVTAAPIHGGRSQGQRERALEKFHRGEVMALVATDVAARGIHVEGVRCVVHYDIPADHKDYTHRSGRTGRAGSSGSVVALVPTAQRKDAAKLMRQADVQVDITDPSVADLPPGYEAFSRASRPKGGGAPKGGAAKARTKPSTKPSPKPDRSSPERTEKPDTRSSNNRAKRRQERFGPPDSPQRKARAVAKTGDGDLDKALDRSQKVRPSGASRRKAKRKALEAAGEPVTRSKKRRSGRPRPPAERSGRR